MVKLLNLAAMAAALLCAATVAACGEDVAAGGPSIPVPNAKEIPPDCVHDARCGEWMTELQGPCHQHAFCFKTVNQFGTATGVCKIDATKVAGSETPCDDGNACTQKDVCTGNIGACAGLTRNCDDKNSCTDDSCDIKKGCVHLAQQVSCTDGDNCTTNDLCKGGVCVGDKIACDDSNPCTSDSCDKVKGCVNTNNTNPCDDGTVCTEGDQCKAGACAPGTSKVCDDSNPCTVDTCDPKTGCKFAAVPEVPPVACSDKDPTTEKDVCKAGVCTGKPFYQCEDDAGCSAKIKTPCGTPVCVPVEGSTIGEKTCQVIYNVNVDDGNACTIDSCDFLKGPVHKPDDKIVCNDNDVCTVQDMCTLAGTCKGAAKSCDDNDPCTNDSCDKNTGLCVHAQMNCEDGDMFTDNYCSFGSCKSTSQVIKATPQMPETYTADEVVANKLTTKLTGWVEDALGGMLSATPVSTSVTFDAKSTCTALYGGALLCFNSWLYIGATKEVINMGGKAVLVQDSITMKTGVSIKPKDAGITLYEQPDACLGWADIPVCVAAKGK